MIELQIPAATYRLQFNRQFRFSDALSWIPYWSRLGITHIYASPVFKSRKNSIHGYDIVDPEQLNPELGLPYEFENLIAEIHHHQMGLVLDLVPNHMAISPENRFWMNFLEDGFDSPYADFFDINWDPYCAVREKKIVLPVLGKPYIRALEDREIILCLENSNLIFKYFDFRFPLNLKSVFKVLKYTLSTVKNTANNVRGKEHEYLNILNPFFRLNQIGEQRSTFNKRIRELIEGSTAFKDLLQKSLSEINSQPGFLDKLLRQQIYRLTFWKSGRKDINFRRFFDIDTLIGVRVEIPRVLEATHSLAFRLAKEGRVNGFRIDHIDGLNDPEGYLRALRKRLDKKEKSIHSQFYITVEKILTGDEHLSGRWPVQGTTGYDFLRILNGIFISKRGLAEMTYSYNRITGSRESFADVVYRKKRKAITELFPGEINSLACQAANLPQQKTEVGSISLSPVKQALIEITACLPVYRTYIRSFSIPASDRNNLDFAFREAKTKYAARNNSLDNLEKIIFLEFPPNYPMDKKNESLRFVMRWQQFTGPVMAKGLEDTALYSYNRLISMNVIGADRKLLPISVSEFHRFNHRRLKFWPHTFNASSTHDTKRSEDAGARINILSEIPDEWDRNLLRWKQINGPAKRIVGGKPQPGPEIEEILYQTLIGSWPLLEDEIPEFRERIKQFMVKAVREAKSYTSWLHPDPEYENAITSFLGSIMDDSVKNEFLENFIPFQQRIAFYGALNSLSQLLLKITSPGLPDFYQGMELWDFSLVDPDNRRPVDFTKRSRFLADINLQHEQDVPSLIRNIREKWKDGRIKLFVTWKALIFRRSNRVLFEIGRYLPLKIIGDKKDHAVAFARQYGRKWAISVVPRFCTGLSEPGSLSLDIASFPNSHLALPEDAPQEWTNVFTGETVVTRRDEGGIRLRDIFAVFPVALLVSDSALH